MGNDPFHAPDQTLAQSVGWTFMYQGLHQLLAWLAATVANPSAARSRVIA